MPLPDALAMGDLTEVDRRLVLALLGAYPTALAIYRFGSRVNGANPPDADLDLAVLVDGHVEPVALWRFACVLAEIAACHVDLVDLRAASTVMQYQIVTRGERLWCLDVRPGIYEAFILSEKTDLDTRRAGLIADIARDGVVHRRMRDPALGANDGR